MDYIIPTVILLILVAIVWWISAYNTFKKMAEKIAEADAGIDAALAKRYATLTKMLEVVKGYAAHEAKTLEMTLKLRSGMKQEEKVLLNNEMDALTKSINVTAEAYPELRSNENFSKLQLAILDCEEHLQAARRLYNSNVSSYNQKLGVFPASIVANKMGLSKAEYFEASEKESSDVEIKF